MEENKFKTFRDMEDTDNLLVFNEKELKAYSTILGNYPYKEALREYEYVQMISTPETIEIVATNIKTLIEYASCRLCDNIRSAERRISNYEVEMANLKKKIDSIHTSIASYKNCIKLLENYKKERIYTNFLIKYNSGETKRHTDKYGNVERIYKLERMDDGDIDIFKTIANIGNDVLFDNNEVKKAFVDVLGKYNKTKHIYIAGVCLKGNFYWSPIGEETLQEIISGVSFNN